MSCRCRIGICQHSRDLSTLQRGKWYFPRTPLTSHNVDSGGDFTLSNVICCLHPNTTGTEGTVAIKLVLKSVISTCGSCSDSSPLSRGDCVVGDWVQVMGEWLLPLQTQCQRRKSYYPAHHTHWLIRRT